MADASLIGVLVGGALTLSGQVGVEATRRRRERAAGRAKARAAARMQRDDIASALEATHRTLATREWWPRDLELPVNTEMQDRRLLANRLPGSDFRRVSGSLRRFAQLRAERDHARVGGRGRVELSDAEYYRALLAYLDLAAARMALAGLAEYDDDPWPLPVELDPALEQKAREQLNVRASADLFARR